MVIVAPSLLAADYGNIKEQIKTVEQAGAKWLHFDIMDGHFVPNLSFGPEFVHQMRTLSQAFFDVHLMVEEPLNFLPMFADCGADMLTVHYEACHDLKQTINAIKQRGIKVGVSIKPATEIDVLKPYLPLIDNILIMTVEPGFGGQKFMENQLPKIKSAAEMIKGKNISLQVDGGINLQTAKLCIEAGANVLVAGNALFRAQNPTEFIKQLQQLGER